MRRGDRERRLINDVRLVLLGEWNPIGFHEYDSYIPGMVRLLISGADPYKLTAHLYTLETTGMGLPGDRDNCRRATEKLLLIPLNRKSELRDVPRGVSRMGQHLQEADGDSPGCLTELMRSLQALAQPAKAQLRLYPDGASKVDELALDFDHWRACAMSRYGSGMSADQSRLLDDLDRLFDSMSGPSNLRHWTEDALRTDPAWVEVRRLAGQVLTAFGWANQPPPPR